MRRNVFFLAAARTTAAGRRQPKKTHSPTTRKLSRTKMPVSAPKAKARIYAVFSPVLVRRCSGVGGDDESRLSVRRRRRRKMVGQEFIATALRAQIIRRRIFPVRLRVKHTTENNRRKGRARTAATTLRAVVAIIGGRGFIKRGGMIVIIKIKVVRSGGAVGGGAAAASDTASSLFFAELSAAVGEVSHQSENETNGRRASPPR